MSGCYFDDTEYFTRVFSNDVSQTDANRHAKFDAISNGKLEEAYKQAADIRKFEIELFWKRGTYYWAFILAAFTAHFALMGMLFSSDSECVNKAFSLKNMCNLPSLSLFALAVTALFCFFFSLAWTLVNKGSKFWQKNWEAHIDMLEDEVTGNLYKTFLNTNLKDDKKEFNWNPICCKAYDYSVTKITTLTSIVMTITSAFLCLFYTILLFLKFCDKSILLCDFKWIIIPVILLCTFIAVIIVLLKFTKSSNFTEERNTDNRWYQRPKVDKGNHET